MYINALGVQHLNKFIRCSTCCTMPLCVLIMHDHCRPIVATIDLVYICRSLCCIVSQGSTESVGGDSQRERHEHLPFPHLLL